ncbi:nicotinamide riboside transporter PnuC [Micromonospora sp. M12]
MAHRHRVSDGRTGTTWAELLGFATGVLTVWLVVRQKIANWPIGIANVLLLMLLFWTTGLYADAGLQIVYVVLGCYGWWLWLFGGERRSRLTVSRTGRRSGWRWPPPGAAHRRALGAAGPGHRLDGAAAGRADHGAVPAGHVRADP